MSKSVKSASVLKSEGKSHYTRQQLAQREAAEDSLLTGIPIREEDSVKADPVAHKEFIRVAGLLDMIGKSDDIYGACINRYCRIRSATLDEEDREAELKKRLEDLEDREESFETEGNLKEYFKLHKVMETSLGKLDRLIMSNYRLLNDMEKESLMTVASSLKATPREKPAPSGMEMLKAILAEDG